MRRALAWIIVIFCTLLYAISSSQRQTQILTLYKIRSNSVFSPDKNRYGDLYGMSFLSYFREHYHNDNNVKAIACEYSRKIDLYMVCDSYVWQFADSGKYYCGVDKFAMAKTNALEKLFVKLDPAKINILLVEFSERNLRNLIKDSLYFKSILTTQNTDPGTEITQEAEGNSREVHQLPGENITRSPAALSIKSRIANFIFNDKINTNIESNIWDMALFRPVKEFKADLNFKLFGSIDKNVRISQNNSQLFYIPTIDTSTTMSSFKYASDNEVNAVVSRLNEMYSKGKYLGFKKIYLSVIPNPVSVLEPGYKGLPYNHLLERIQGDPKLQMPCIDIMADFKQLKSAVYQTSDSHWNWNGVYSWLNKVNTEFSKAIKEESRSMKR